MNERHHEADVSAGGQEHREIRMSDMANTSSISPAEADKDKVTRKTRPAADSDQWDDAFDLEDDCFDPPDDWEYDEAIRAERRDDDYEIGPSLGAL
jgi:hypothetical protein